MKQASAKIEGKRSWLLSPFVWQVKPDVKQTYDLFDICRIANGVLRLDTKINFGISIRQVIKDFGLVWSR